MQARDNRAPDSQAWVDQAWGKPDAGCQARARRFAVPSAPACTARLLADPAQDERVGRYWPGPRPSTGSGGDGARSGTGVYQPGQGEGGGGQQGVAVSLLPAVVQHMVA